jgi:hypothetical protein
MKITERYISMLRCQPLQKVLAAHGHYPRFEKGGRLYYVCPFHNDHNPSFSIESGADGDSRSVQRYVCASCGVGGSGPLELEAEFLGKPADSLEVILSVSTIMGMVAEGKEEAEFVSRRSVVDPSPAYQFEYKEDFSDEDLEALGCRRRLVYASTVDEVGETHRVPLYNADGSPRFAYSWGDNFYGNLSDAYLQDEDYCNFNRSEISRVFSVFPVKWFVTKAKADKNGVLQSYRVESSRVYPIFNFAYGGHTWGKKYEPYYRPGHMGGSKFMFWYAAGAPQRSLATMVYGDVDVMNYLRTGDVNDIRETKVGEKAAGLFAHSEVDAQGNQSTRNVFRHLIICSGPRDAMSVYFHSGAHVVWFNSESADMSTELFAKLKACCEDIYICFDIDRTGEEEANRWAMKHLGLRIIHLPKVLSEYVDARTGKPAKDAENFFNLYRPNNNMESMRFYGNVEQRFSTLIQNSVDMQFFHEVKRSSKKYAQGFFIDYEISGNSALQLAEARGIFRYTLDENRHIYVRVSDNVVDIIPEKDIVKVIRGEMKDFVSVIRGIRSYPKLCDAITKSQSLNRDTCIQLADVDLNLRSWDEDTEYFPFRNGVVKVTKDSVRKLSYREAPFHFFRSSILPNDFEREVAPTFRIYRDELGLAEKRREIEARKTRGMSDAEKEVLESEYLSYERLWAYRVEWLKPYEEQPIAVRFVYEAGRVYWKDERAGIALSPQQKQEQDLHFIVKCNAFGYLLSRYRDRSKAFLVQWADYSCLFGGKASGRTGKTALASLIGCVRHFLLVPGKGMKTHDNFAKNFAKFRFGVQSNILIDDLSSRIDEEQFYNLNSVMEVKTLYEDEVTIREEDCPKVQITSNRMPRMDSSSTEGRFMMVPVGGPIGYHKVNGQTVEMSVRKMFGCNIPDGLTPEEYTLCQNFMMWCLQFYLSHKDIIRPFMGHEGKLSMASGQVGNKDFVQWANEYFADESKFGMPLSRREMYLDYREYLGERPSIYCSKADMNEFKGLLRSYCDAMQYVFMPRVCYRRSLTDEKDESIRLTTWVTQKDENGYRIKRGDDPAGFVLAKGERVVYVFRAAADVPATFDELVKPDKKNPPRLDEFQDEDE